MAFQGLMTEQKAARAKFQAPLVVREASGGQRYASLPFAPFFFACS